MGPLRRRVEAKIRRWGVDLVVGGTAVRALTQDLQSSQLSTYFDYSEQSAVVRPGLQLVLGAEAAVSVGDTFAVGGRTYTVKKIADQSLGGEVVCRIVIAY